MIGKRGHIAGVLAIIFVYHQVKGAGIGSRPANGGPVSRTQVAIIIYVKQTSVAVVAGDLCVVRSTASGEIVLPAIDHIESHKGTSSDIHSLGATIWR